MCGNNGMWGIVSRETAGSAASIAVSIAISVAINSCGKVFSSSKVA